MTTVERPLRADAARNRERLLAAAAEVFAENGLDAGVELIAQRAGVGMGTLYRRFPTKEALVAALVVDLLTEVLDVARAAVALGDGTGLEVFLRRSTELQQTHRGCIARLWSGPETDGLLADVRAATATLLRDAQRAGTVRPEITPADITMLFYGLRGVLETTATVAPGAWRRHLEIVLAGLAPGGPPLRQPAPTEAQAAAIRRGSAHR